MGLLGDHPLKFTNKQRHEHEQERGICLPVCQYRFLGTFITDRGYRTSLKDAAIKIMRANQRADGVLHPIVQRSQCPARPIRGILVACILIIHRTAVVIDFGDNP